jgi:hypothetical protein
MKARFCWVALCISAGLSCTTESAPNGQVWPDPEEERDAAQCPEPSERVGDDCLSEEQDSGPRRVPMLDAGTMKPLDAGRADSGSTPGDAGLRGDAGDASVRNDAGDASLRSDAGDASSGSDAGDAAVLDAPAACGMSANRFAIAGDDEFLYQGPGLIVDELDGSTIVNFEADDAGLTRDVWFKLPNNSWELRFSTRELDAGMNVGVYEDADSLPVKGLPLLWVNTATFPCYSGGEFQVFEINVKPRDLDAGTPAQLRSFHARFETHCQDGTRHNFTEGCFRYTASP